MVGRKFTFWVVYDTTGDRQFVKMDSDTGCLAMFDNEESAATFASGLAGVGYKEVVLYSQPSEVVGWQFYQDGKWWNGVDSIKDHKRNTQEAGYRVRDVYATPQLGEQKPAADVTQLVEALKAIVSHHDEYFRDSSVESKMPWIKQARSALAAYHKGENM